MADHDTKFAAKALPKHNTWRAETVTHTAYATGTATSGISALYKHQPDLSPETQGPYQQRTYWLPTASVAAPRRADTITDSGGTVWTIVDIRTPRSGLTYCQCRIGQVDA